MLGVDPDFGTSALRLWIAAGSTALLFLLCVFALFQPRLRIALGPVRRAGVVILSAALGAAILSSLLVRPTADDRGAERRNFELRAAELNARALAPGSPLACLDALAGKSLEAACEKALFASPASVAAATSYVAAQLALLSGMAAYAEQDDTNIDDLALPLRRSLEADRFGFVAHVLAVRDACTSENCETFALLHEVNRVRGNLSAETFDHNLEHYVALWNAAAEKAVADAAPPPSTPVEPNPPPHKAVSIDFPTAASIPAVSIMNPEPSGPVLPGVAAAAAANPNPQAGSPAGRHPRKQTSGSAPPSPAQSASSGATAVEPIWPEPVPLAPASAPQTTAAPAATAPIQAPIQLSPPSTAAAGAAARTQ